MKIELLRKDLNYYKANLHSHSTLSDGAPTPEEMKAAYKAKGYSVLAITDHNVFLPHNELTEKDFLMLNGIEYNADPNDGSGRTCHFCAIAPTPEVQLQPLFHRTKYCIRGAVEARKLVKYDETLPDYERTYSSEGVSEMMRTCREAGFFVTYNHPTWSLEHYPEYMGYEGMNAMEIVNYACLEMGYPEVNECVYDDMLTGGKRVFCVANDDNHTVTRDAFGGFTVIGAEELTYKSVMDALFAGRFYASTGAAISALYIEDGKIHIETPEAKEIRLFTGSRAAKRAVGTREEPLTHAAFEIPKGNGKYFRVVVTDFEGGKAFSNAYFYDTLGVTPPENK